ncbi:PTS IIA-like nitrogen regulatory protein PtsN [Pseudoalteromonas denitrificans]|uniref:PTS IIA-like nitrogen-regulatory protein PtsN n=1 Tax=Pseudoalteromonas denitrificans DSM 6059 TaxID=1123010 RepID=A0A1I1R7V5_9GAMM|nr:PTS IIA-like nitrogen regulatory protein PtsN [Pseudoalteromonas denitrificans]SFD30237.1 PTS IIA-like nitrogen-regulatory protein PtsN [Pseudoalteromonas denitrificans DSM 6059]
MINLFLSKDCTKAAVLFHSKKRILEYISQVAHQKLPELSEHEILNSLLKREKLGSTGIGKGIALPHGRLSNIEQTLAILVVNEEPIAFDAIDDRPVDIFITLLVPDVQCQTHLKTLAAIADKLKDKQFCKKLRNAQSDQNLYDIIAD